MLKLGGFDAKDPKRGRQAPQRPRHFDGLRHA